MQLAKLRNSKHLLTTGSETRLLQHLVHPATCACHCCFSLDNAGQSIPSLSNCTFGWTAANAHTAQAKKCAKPIGLLNHRPRVQTKTYLSGQLVFKQLEKVEMAKVVGSNLAFETLSGVAQRTGHHSSIANEDINPWLLIELLCEAGYAV